MGASGAGRFTREGSALALNNFSAHYAQVRQRRLDGPQTAASAISPKSSRRSCLAATSALPRMWEPISVPTGSTSRRSSGRCPSSSQSAMRARGRAARCGLSLVRRHARGARLALPAHRPPQEVDERRNPQPRSAPCHRVGATQRFVIAAACPTRARMRRGRQQSAYEPARQRKPGARVRRHRQREIYLICRSITSDGVDCSSPGYRSRRTGDAAVRPAYAVPQLPSQNCAASRGCRIR
jgi:hypothetical protein